MNLLVRSRGLEPPRVAPLAPQASASTTSATTAAGLWSRPKARRRTTADHVTNWSRSDKGGRGHRDSIVPTPLQGWRLKPGVLEGEALSPGLSFVEEGRVVPRGLFWARP